MHFGVSNIIFLVVFITAIVLFAKRIMTITRNIKLGKGVDRSDNASERLSTMLRVAVGQSKMVVRPVSGILHILVYVGFIIINIELLEIVIDGALGTHRVLSVLGPLYDLLIASFEILAVGVIIACVVFLIRRNIIKLKRFWSKEMTSWPRSDANIILITEIALMCAFLSMDTADFVLQSRGAEHYHEAGAYPVASLLAPLFNGLSDSALVFVERFGWWFHIIGILCFLVYVTYSKHFHIMLAFPNVYFSNLKSKGQFNNMESVKKEVELMFDPNADPYAAPPPAEEGAVPEKFGARDVTDLNWKQLMDSYTCTECGRCTSNCPANITGKKLSPRKIVMDTRDRLEEVGKNIDTNGGEFKDDGKSLLHDYITPEELWACTTCNACTEACPVNIDPLSIIVDLRRNLVMEESSAPSELVAMFTNVENNSAPWQFSPTDRFNWAQED